jgi:hypothetical protein
MAQTDETKAIKAKVRAAKQNLQKAERLILDAEKGEVSVHIGSLLAAGYAMMATHDAQDAERNARGLHAATEDSYHEEVSA